MCAMAETSFLAAFDAQTQQEAERQLLACCASPRWAGEVAARRPYHDLATMQQVSDTALAVLPWPDVLEALSAHPRIGERAEGDSREAAWSRAEQSSATGSSTDERRRAELAEANAEYERRFGHVFLVCATGLSADEVLAALRYRLANDPDTEQRVVREELGRIVRLRLAKLVGR
jgi:2-oxo-4-hydroxy-4-carboxy-5-ureidoimidazoline decarboxylase